MASRLFRLTCLWLWRGKKNYSWPYYSSLPDEIQEQILLKLQCFKSIVTCTSVCKSWHALIKSRNFIAMHLSRPQSNAEYFLCSSYFKPLCHSILCYNSQRLESYRDLIFPVRRVKVLGSCNGLICYTKYADVFGDINLWNPTIQKLKILPKSKYLRERAAYGFWYDTYSDDYKVVKIYSGEISKVEVYSLSNNSWDLIATSGPSYSKTFFDNVVLHVNGTLYWVASDRKNWWDSYWRIVTLNMKDLMFRDTLLWPIEKSRSGGKFDMLGAGSRVILVFSSFNSGTHHLGIHVYDENLNELYRYESENSDIELEFLSPLGVRNSGNEVLFQKFGTDAPILVFDTRESKFKEFCSSTKSIIRAIPFVETLVLLDDGDSRSPPNARQQSVIRNATGCCFFSII